MKFIIKNILLALIFLFYPGLVLADSGSGEFGGCGMMGTFSGSNGFGMMGIGWIFSILILILIIIGIIALIKVVVRPENKSSLNILEERYAKGEISKKEFEQRKKDIS